MTSETHRRQNYRPLKNIFYTHRFIVHTSLRQLAQLKRPNKKCITRQLTMEYDLNI